jgi:hypothetical protein
VTDEGLAELRGRVPFSDLSALEKDRRVGHIGGLFTVDLVARYIEGKVAARGS